MRAHFQEAQTVVIKVGTRALMDSRGEVDPVVAGAIARSASRILKAGGRPVIVTSGAVELGRVQLGFVRSPEAHHVRRACAAVGQPWIVAAWDRAVGANDLRVGQLLLTHDDARDRAVLLRSTLGAMWQRAVVPVVNANDPVADDELIGPMGHGDNDTLASLVAIATRADLLVLLTDVAGVYDRDPRYAPDAQLIEVDGETDFQAGPGSPSGRGGIASKVRAARRASATGVEVVVAGGHPGTLQAILDGEEVGTWFPAKRAA